ncbi:MAG: hypothetical protein JWO87_1880 [Phycisphaerales bacterium]|nr:hypothetical protein [Phycisphaerales bacterium]
METIPTDQFFAWAQTRGIVLDPVYSPPKCLVYDGVAAESRWWDVPRQAGEVNRFISHLLTGVGTWKECYLWRRGGCWPNVAPPRNRLEAARRMVAMGPAIPDGFAGAVKYTAEELSLMVGRVTAHVMSGLCVNDDLFLLPDDGRHIVHTDHHDVVHVSSLDTTAISRLIGHMAGGGYSLPAELLDWTFKRPSWMP